MIRFFNFLNITKEEQDKLPKDLIDGGRLIDGMQLIYEEIPSGRRKDILATTIAEMSSILLKKLNELRFNIVASKNIEEEIKEVEGEDENPIIEEPIVKDPINEKRTKEKIFLEDIRKNLNELEF
jgi:hypothetical protein